MTPILHASVVGLNALASLASAASGVIALVRPSALSGTRDRTVGERYFARLYAVRAILLGPVFATAPVVLAGGQVQPVLFFGAGVQAADMLVALAPFKGRMLASAGVAAAIHLLSGMVLQ